MSESEIERKNDISDTRCTRHTIFYVCHIYMYWSFNILSYLFFDIEKKKWHKWHMTYATHDILCVSYIHTFVFQYPELFFCWDREKKMTQVTHDTRYSMCVIYICICLSISWVIFFEIERKKWHKWHMTGRARGRARESTAWRRCIGCLILIRHFPPKSPIIIGSFAKRDLQLKAAYSSSRPCIKWGDRGYWRNFRVAPTQTHTYACYGCACEREREGWREREREGRLI